MKTLDDILNESRKRRVVFQERVSEKQPTTFYDKTIDIREMYVNKEIFNVGDIVQETSTGNIGKIIRRGANYLICVTEDNRMFKPWLTDVVEWTKVSGVPPEQREVGTDSLRKYVMSLNKVKNIKNFINKYSRKHAEK